MKHASPSYAFSSAWVPWTQENLTSAFAVLEFACLQCSGLIIKSKQTNQEVAKSILGDVWRKVPDSKAGKLSGGFVVIEVFVIIIKIKVFVIIIKIKVFVNNN